MPALSSSKRNTLTPITFNHLPRVPLLHRPNWQWLMKSFVSCHRYDRCVYTGETPHHGHIVEVPRATVEQIPTSRSRWNWNSPHSCHGNSITLWLLCFFFFFPIFPIFLGIKLLALSKWCLTNMLVLELLGDSRSPFVVPYLWLKLWTQCLVLNNF